MGSFSHIYRLYNTVKYLKPTQIYRRLWFKVHKPKPDTGQAPGARSVKKPWISLPSRKPSFFPEKTFFFLNTRGRVNTASDWNDPKKDKLWLYNLHYFDDLQAFDFHSRIKEHKKLIERWILDNPPVEGNGWEPYPLSLRIVNWIKWALVTKDLSDNALHSLAVQTRYLGKRCEYHLLGNHLFANGKALLFSGLFFQGKQAEKWRSRGMKIIETGIKEQILSDGGNFERTPMYHALFLEDVLDIINILKTYECPVPSWLEQPVAPMGRWLNVMTHPDGEISFFNDAALGIAPPFKTLARYTQALNLPSEETTREDLVVLEQSGYARVRKDRMTAIIDMAPIGPDYIPGHAHADSLSFELSLFEKRCLVNSGTSLYGTGQERLRQRGTAAHNTLSIDGENSSEVWGGFRVARRARIKNISFALKDGEITLSAAHTGYRRLPGKPVHERKWSFFDRKLVIEDKVISGKSHSIDIHFHIHPHWDVTLQKNQAILKQGDMEVLLVSDSCGELQMEDSSYHPEFGLSVPGKKLVFHWQGTCPSRFLTSICW
jgi:uncharacterized heparinase superfamily protein